MQDFSAAFSGRPRRIGTTEEEKKEVCPEAGCGKRFFHRTDLYRHQRIKHGAEPKRRGRGMIYPSFGRGGYSQEFMNSMNSPADDSTFSSATMPEADNMSLQLSKDSLLHPATASIHNEYSDRDHSSFSLDENTPLLQDDDNTDSSLGS